jgi:hypothetical protein
MAQRDPRIDLLRGLSLLVIFVDHVEAVCDRYLLSHLTFPQFRLSDALEGFVFLSGWVFGLVHNRVQDALGFSESLSKSVRRAIQLAFANGLCLLAVLWLVWALDVSPQIISELRLGESVDNPLISALTTVLPFPQPYGFDILPLYCVVLCIAPLLLLVAKRASVAAMAMSLVVYIMGQLDPLFPVTADASSGWEYQPLAWQLVFFAGCMTSLRVQVQSVDMVHRVRLGLAVAGLVIFTWVGPMIHQYLEHLQMTWLLDKRTAGPLRLAHFALVAIVFSTLADRFPDAPNWPVLRWLTLCGRHSLPVFLLGLWLTHLAAILCAGAHHAELLLFEVNGIALSILAAAACEGCWRPSKKNSKISG